MSHTRITRTHTHSVATLTRTCSARCVLPALSAVCMAAFACTQCDHTQHNVHTHTQHSTHLLALFDQRADDLRQHADALALRWRLCELHNMRTCDQCTTVRAHVFTQLSRTLTCHSPVRASRCCSIVVKQTLYSRMIDGYCAQSVTFTHSHLTRTHRTKLTRLLKSSSSTNLS
jgi:hypothetical protein